MPRVVSNCKSEIKRGPEKERRPGLGRERPAEQVVRKTGAGEQDPVGEKDHSTRLALSEEGPYPPASVLHQFPPIPHFSPFSVCIKARISFYLPSLEQMHCLQRSFLISL